MIIRFISDGSPTTLNNEARHNLKGFTIVPRTVDITVHHLANTALDRPEIEEWLNRIGVSDDFVLPHPDDVSSGELLTSLAAKRCYMSFEPGLNPNVEKVRTDYIAYLENILRSGHGSVLEHVTHTYAIEGCTRVFTAEMNRHRAGWAISEGSMRYIRFDDIPFWMPTIFREKPDDDSFARERKYKTRRAFASMFEEAEIYYRHLVELWDLDNPDNKFAYKKQVTSALRRIVPMGVSTGGVWTGNIRAIRHVLALRTDPAAEEEIFHIMRLIGDDIIRREEKLFQDFDRRDNGSLVPGYRKV